MKLKTLLLTTAALLALASNVFGSTIKTITFGLDATYPPFDTVSPSGEIAGLDVDIAKALCAQMKTQCTFVNQPFDSLIPSLQIGKFDAIISAMSITPEREKTVDFTQPYFLDTASFIAPNNANFDVTPGKMSNKTIGVQKGTTFQAYLNATYGNKVAVKTYASQESAFSDLAAGRIDAVMGDTPLLANWLKTHGNGQYHFVGKPIVNKEYFGVGFGIAVKKGNTKLLEALNQAIAAAQKDGTLKKLNAQYFPQQ